MAQPMAFRAAYSDWRLIKTRGVIQVVLEVPLADADAAYNVLGGMPDASRENWFAVAPLKLPPAEKETSSTTPATPEAAHKPPPLAKRTASGEASSRSRMDWRELQPAAQAGIRAGDPVFRKFLLEMHGWVSLAEEDAAKGIRAFCGVESRSELGSNHKARVLWKQLDDQFSAWRVLERT